MHLLEWLKLERLTMSSVGKIVKELEFSYSVGENAKWCNHFENVFDNSVKS